MATPRVGDEFGRYRLDRVLGQGGMGIVFAATDQRLGRTVAVKVITGALAESPEFRARFQQEAELLARLDSAHVIAIFDHDELDGTPYIVTQLVTGPDLATRLAQGPMTMRDALTVGAQAARGLRDAHDRGLVHRDVKPANVLLRGSDGDTPGRELHAYLCDFGIARGEEPAAEARTATGAIAGTRAYLAPERATGAAATPASDLYALGCVLWAALTGSEPYTGTEVQVLLAHQQAPVPQLGGRTELTREIDAVLARLLAKDPAERYPDAAAAVEALTALAARAPDEVAPRPDVAVTTLPGSTTVRADPTAATTAAPRRRGLLLVAAAAAVVLVVGGLAWALTRDDDAGEAPADDGPAAVVGGDLDGDGHGDALVNQVRPLAVDSEGLRALLSNGVRFGSPVESDAQPGYPKTADVDGDGALDVVWVDSFDDDTRLTVSVVPAQGDPWEPVEVPVDPALGIDGYSAEVDDVTGDSHPDLVLLGDPSKGTDTIYVAEADGRGFDEPEAWYDTTGSGGTIWTGDFDGDGDGSVLYYSPDDKSDLLTLLSPDDGAFTEEASRPLTGPAINPTIAPLLVGDVDGDGADELVSPGVTRRAVFVIGIDNGEIGARERWHHTKRDADEARDQIFNSGVADYTLSDVDGDGLDDLVELHRSDGADELTMVVLASTGSAFDDPAVRGTFSCDAGCDDGFSLVD